MTQLTPHFSLEELIYSHTAISRGINNFPNAEVEVNLTNLANVLEKVRALLGHPITISSGYRCNALNNAVGGVWDSAHLHGMAADIECSEFGTPIEVCEFLEDHMKELGIDQLILEFNSWTHIGLAQVPRNMALTIDRSGTREGFSAA